MIDIQKHTPEFHFPQLSVIAGKPKIGKSTKMAELPEALIIAVDPIGYKGISVEALYKAPTLPDVTAALQFFFSKENEAYKILVIDDLRSLTQLFDNQARQKEGVKYLADIGYGKGAMYVKDDIYNFLAFLRKYLDKNPDKIVFLVAHADDRGGEIRLDINGKNETMVLSAVDAIGYVSRDIDEHTTITFSAGRGVEFGSRNPFLAKYNGVLDWDTLFKMARGELPAAEVVAKPKKATKTTK